MKSIYINITLLLIAFLTMIAAATMYFYMYRSVNSSTDRALEARDIAATESSSKSQEADLAKIYVDTESSRARLHAFFISEEEVVSFVEAIEALGPKSGAKISLSDLSVAAGTAKNLKWSRAHVTVDGTWSSVMRALELSETLPYDIEISGVRLSSSSSSKDQSWDLSYDLAAAIIPAATVKPSK